MDEGLFPKYSEHSCVTYQTLFGNFITHYICKSHILKFSCTLNFQEPSKDSRINF